MRILSGVAAILFLLLLLTVPAGAHTWEVSDDCDGLTVDLQNYNTNGANSVLVVIDNQTQADVADFGGSYTETFTWDASGHSWMVVVEAWDDPTGNANWTFSLNGEQDPCATTTIPSSTTTPTTTTTTPTTTTTTADTTTTEPQTTTSSTPPTTTTTIEEPSTTTTVTFPVTPTTTTTTTPNTTSTEDTTTTTLPTTTTSDPPTTTTKPADSPSTSDPPKDLPRTGTTGIQLAAAALLLLTTGGILIWARNR